MTEDHQRLLALYAPPAGRAVTKQLSCLDSHCRRFISLSPFMVLCSGASDGRYDASPRGGEPGFVKVISDARILLPDAPGNNRLDSLQNIVQTGRVGTIFFVPGVDETLRVNGRASLSDDATLIARFADERRVPKLVVVIDVEEAYLHCAKALMRSKLWHPETRIARSTLPSMGKMINDQIGSDLPAEPQEVMLARYAKDL